MTSIEARDLMLRRASGFQLGPLSLDIPTRSRTALAGPSGCGKTTMLRCLAGLELPADGVISFGGRVVHDRRAIVAPSERRIGFVFQDSALWPHLTAVQHLRFVDPSLSRAQATALLDRVGLGDLGERRPAALSGGEGQRLALARALAGDPDVLMLDEPLHSVDVHLRDELSLLIRNVADEHQLTLIVVTHDRDEALAMADQLVILRAGAIVESGPAAELLRRPRTAYGAAFLCRAACLPARPDGEGRLATAFGSLDGPAGDDGAVALVLLPGDVVVAASADGDRPVGRVLQVVPMHDAAIATVELHGHTLQVPCDPDVRGGASLPLALRAAPRFLPIDGPGARG